MIDRKEWPEPESLSLDDLKDWDKSFKRCVILAQFDIDNYDEIYKRYIDIKSKERERDEGLSKIDREIESINSSLFKKLSSGKRLRELSSQRSEWWKFRDDMVDYYHKKNPILDPFGDVIGLGKYEDRLCWTTNERVVSPSTDEFRIYNDISYSEYDRLMEPEEGKEWIRTNELIPSVEQSSILNDELVRRLHSISTRKLRRGGGGVMRSNKDCWFICTFIGACGLYTLSTGLITFSTGPTVHDRFTAFYELNFALIVLAVCIGGLLMIVHISAWLVDFVDGVRRPFWPCKLRTMARYFYEFRRKRCLV